MTNIFNIILSQDKDNNLIPKRKLNAVTGSQFISDNISYGGYLRENNILSEFLSGNIPDFLRSFKSITITNKSDYITYLVTSDFLSIGTNEDYVRIPMNPLTAKKIADKYNCTLPTKKMSLDIYTQSLNKLPAMPWGPPYDLDMERTHRFGTHNSTIQKQLLGKDFTALNAGHKKDVIIDKRLINSKTVGIYGWFNFNGIAIQGPDANCSSHSNVFKDYSHGIRLIYQDVIVNGNLMNVFDVLSDKNLCSLLSDQGAYLAKNIYT